MVFEAPLPAEFPRYLTSNPYNLDVGDIALTDKIGRKFNPTYFDVINEAGEFQINFTRHGKLELATTGDQPPDVILTWKDRFAGQGIEIVKFTYNSVMIRTNTEKERFLVYMDRYDKRWKCYIDDHQTPIYRTNIEFKGVLVPKGQHEIYFVYADPVLKTAWAIFTFGYLASCLIVVVCVIRTPKS